MPLAGAFLLLMGAGIAGMWTLDIVRSPQIDRSRGLLCARDRDGGVLLPHRLAEDAAAAGLLVAGLGLLAGWAPGGSSWLVAVAVGALAYSSLSSLSWVLSDRSRLAYAAPMVVGLAGSLAPLARLLGGAIPPPAG